MQHLLGAFLQHPQQQQQAQAQQPGHVLALHAHQQQLQHIAAHAAAAQAAALAHGHQQQPHPHGHHHHHHPQQQAQAAHHAHAHAHMQHAHAHHHHHHQQHQQAFAHMNAHAAAHASGGGGAGGGDFLSSLAIQSPIDVYDIHEAGWRRALLLAKRDRHEYLVRYIGWDSKWDEWIRASAGRLAPANSKTASLAYTGFKGPKSADEVASMELGRDWNAARQEGVMCDVLFALRVGQAQRRPGQRLGNGIPLHGTPTKPTRNNSSSHHSARKDDSEFKGSSAAAAAAASNGVTRSAPTTPATSPLMGGLSSAGAAPLLFSAHRHMINMRCPDLLKPALTSLPPVAHFDDASVGAPYTPYTGPRAAPSAADERKDDTGGRSLADQEAAATAAAGGSTVAASASSILHQHSFPLSDTDVSASPEQPSSAGGASSASASASPAAPLLSLEEKTRSLDDDDDMSLGGGGGGLSSGLARGGVGASGSSFTELHPSVETFDVCCVPNAATMHNLLTYIYTGDLSMPLLSSVRHVFELASVAHVLRLERLQDLCALALNRMLHQDNFLQALRMGLHYQSKVLGSLESICQDLAELSAAASASLAGEIHASHSSLANAKVHPALSPMVRVVFEYLVLHWEICWARYENLVAFQQLPPTIFHAIMRLTPLRNLVHAPFAPIYPTIHPQACSLTQHFKRLYEERNEENTDFKIVIGDDHDNVIYVHKAVLACRSEYFRALFRCSFSEGQENVMRLDATQHNHASMLALVKYLYSGDLRVDPDCGVYLSNCTDFFGLSSNALEHACQELVSQHHCLKVLKSAWKTCNEGLFKRACKFIDWTTLAALMNGRGAVPPAARAGAGAAAAASAAAMDDEEDEGEEELDEAEEGEEEEAEGEDDEEGEEGEAQEDEDADVPAGASASSPPPSSSLSPPRRRASPSASSDGAASGSGGAVADPSDIEMWKAIVSEKANPSAAGPFSSFAKHAHSGSHNKRARTST